MLTSRYVQSRQNVVQETFGIEMQNYRKKKATLQVQHSKERLRRATGLKRNSRKLQKCDLSPRSSLKLV